MSQTPRKKPRIPFEDLTIVKMVDTTEPDTMNVGESIMCSTVDVSVIGIRLCVGRQLPVGSRMEIWVKSKAQEGTLKVMGTVIWCHEVEAAIGLQAGMEIVDDPNTDFAEYQKRVSKIFPS